MNDETDNKYMCQCYPSQSLQRGKRWGVKEMKNDYAYLLFIIYVVREFLLADVGISQQHLHYCLCKPLHEPLPDLWVWTLQL